ncbi:hypothetical protein [Clostridium sp. HBUAS56017]|uniref:hypothetical protein n=1 Tax=Clostridium sp. HBUAS56017 TaxID=2571128 RepID=UPI0011788218|nr:hypothetical protein [Clostridium sp. HBUAS56017]
MSTVELRLPSTYLEVEKDEMEYVDGGANYQKYWWGWSIDLDSKECGTMGDLLDLNLGLAGTATAISGFIGGPVGIGAALASLAYGAGVLYVKTELKGCANQGLSATLSKNFSGYHVNMW